MLYCNQFKGLAGLLSGGQGRAGEHQTSRQVDALAGSDWKIIWKPVTSTRLDTAALKKALKDVAERFTKTSTSRHFVLA